MNKKEKIRNSIRAYILGDALGVPFEFREEGCFDCEGFAEFGTHNQPLGTWSDDSSILLCLINTLSREDISDERKFKTYIDNLKDWCDEIRFNAGSRLFDIGGQTSLAIREGGSQKTSRMGNGALFYSLPIAIYTLDKSDKESKEMFEKWCAYTHNNDNCFEYGYKFCCILKRLLCNLPLENVEVKFYENRGDVINTYNLVLDHYLSQENKSSTLFEDLCSVICWGNDTDTNAALLGAVLGMKKRIREEDWKKIRRHKVIDEEIDLLLNSLSYEDEE